MLATQLTQAPYNSGLLRNFPFSPIDRCLITLTLAKINKAPNFSELYYLALHESLLSRDTLKAIESGDPLPDGRLNTLRKSIRSLIDNNGLITLEEITDFLTAGYSTKQYLYLQIHLLRPCENIP